MPRYAAAGTLLYTLMKSYPAACCSRTTRAPSRLSRTIARPEVSITAANSGGGSPSMIAPAVWMSGPMSSPRRTRSRKLSVCGPPDRMRTPVTPVATNRPSAHSSRKWTCMSLRPGMRNRPRASTRVAPSGSSMSAGGPTASTRPPPMRTVMPGRTRSPSIGMTETPSMARVASTGGGPSPELQAKSAVRARHATAEDAWTRDVTAERRHAGGRRRRREWSVIAQSPVGARRWIEFGARDRPTARQRRTRLRLRRRHPARR